MTPDSAGSNAQRRSDGQYREWPVSVLHIVEPAAPDAGPCALRLLGDVMERVESVSHQAIVMGSAGDCRLAVECGIEPRAGLCPPRAWPLSGQHALRQLVHEMEAEGARVDLIHAWTARSAALAAMALPRTPRALSIHVGGGGERGWRSRTVARVLSRRPPALLAASRALLRECEMPSGKRGFGAVLPLGADPFSRHYRDRDSIRWQWKTELGLDRDTFVVGLLAEPISCSDAYAATVITARLRLAGRNVRLMVHPTAARRLLAQRLVGELSMGRLIITIDDLAQPWRILKGLDAAMVFGPATPTHTCCLPMLWALASGVGVVTDERANLESDSDSSPLIVDGESGMVVESNDLNEASDRIARLYDDRNASARMAGRAIAQVSASGDMRDYCGRLAAIYDHLSGRMVHARQGAAQVPDESAEAQAMTSAAS